MTNRSRTPRASETKVSRTKSRSRTSKTTSRPKSPRTSDNIEDHKVDSDSSEFKSEINRPYQESRNNTDLMTTGQFFLATSVSQDIREKSTRAFRQTAENMLTSDDGCDPNVQEVFTGLINIKKIASEKHQQLGKLVDSVSDKLDEVMEKAEKFYMNPSMDYVQNFFNAYRSMCGSIKVFFKKIQNPNVTNHEIHERFLTLVFDYENMFLVQYNIISEKLRHREEYSRSNTSSPYQPKRNIFLRMIGKFWGLTKWIWKYKYILYISSVLLYNIKTYVLPDPIERIMDIFIRLSGAICYTFASDTVSLTKLMDFITSCIMVMCTTAFGLIKKLIFPSFLNFLNYLPKFVFKSIEVGRVCIFYLFTWFCIDWVSYLIKLICQGIVLSRVAFLQGDLVMSSVWEGFVNVASELQGSFIRAKNFVSAALSKGYTLIFDVLSRIFIGAFYDGFVVPMQEFVVSIPSKLSNWVKNMWSAASDEKGLTIVNKESFIHKIYKSIQDSYSSLEISTVIDKNQIETAVAAVRAAETMEASQLALSNNANIFSHQVAAVTRQVVDDAYNKIILSFDQVKQNTEKLFQETLRSIGTEKLWGDLKQLNFSNNFTGYIIGIMFMITLFSILFR